MDDPSTTQLIASLPSAFAQACRHSRSDGELFEVSTASLTCAPTAFVPAQSALGAPFGCGFVADPSGAPAPPVEPAAAT